MIKTIKKRTGDIVKFNAQKTQKQKNTKTQKQKIFIVIKT